MTPQPKPDFKKRYFRLTDLASKYQLEASELLSYAIEGKLYVCIEDFNGIGKHDENADEPSAPEIKCHYPQWAIFIVSDALKKLAINGNIFLGGGFRQTPTGMKPVFFQQERKITINDLIVPVEALADFANLACGSVSQLDTPITPVGRETLLKQLAGLALVVAKLKGGYNVGNKPNQSAIAQAVLKTFDELPKELHGTLNLEDLSQGSIRNHIREGLRLIKLLDAGG